MLKNIVNKLTGNQDARLVILKSKAKIIGSGASAYGEQSEQVVKTRMKELFTILNRFPGESEFMGKNLKYSDRKSNFFFKRKFPNIGDLRDKVNKANDSEIAVKHRQKIKKILRKYPDFGDIHALHAIQVFNDTSQSGLDEKKLEVIQGSLIEMAIALNNDAASIFNISWFIKIYLRYLDSLKEKIVHELVNTENHYHRDVRKLAEDLKQMRLKITALQTIKDKLTPLAVLSKKLQGTVYIVDCITEEEIREACIAFQKEDKKKKISHGKTANFVIYVFMTINLLFARIPILKKLVLENVSKLPNVSRDIVLQKSMITTITKVTDFQLSLAGGDRKEARDVADNLFKYCSHVIEQHLEYSAMTKQHEIDPFLKLAWIAKESNSLYSDTEYNKVLTKAKSTLDVVIRKTHVKSALEMAQSLNNQIDYIMVENGWT